MFLRRSAASSGSLYRNMLVLPSTMTQPWERRTASSMGEALTRQRLPGKGWRVATPPSRRITQCRGRMLGWRIRGGSVAVQVMHFTPVGWRVAFLKKSRFHRKNKNDRVVIDP